MMQNIYHGDPSREHRFWVYPKHKSLINPQWDTYDPTQLCNNFTLLNGFTEIKMYQCNGHQNGWPGGAGVFYPGMQGNISMPQMIYHGDPSREHHFWVYPKHKSLINPQWDTYDPTQLCNNFTVLDLNHSTQVRRYKCNGHPNGSPGGAGVLYPGMQGNIPMPQMIYHGDPSREHRFWVYPKHKSLINPQWDTYDPHDLCNNFTLLNGFTDKKMYQCNGHPNVWPGGAGGFYPAPK